jgi:hypothetical protein
MGLENSQIFLLVQRRMRSVWSNKKVSLGTSKSKKLVVRPNVYHNLHKSTISRGFSTIGNKTFLSHSSFGKQAEILLKKHCTPLDSQFARPLSSSKFFLNELGKSDVTTNPIQSTPQDPTAKGFPLILPSH